MSSLNLDDDNDDSTSPEVMSVRSESEPERKREVKMEKPKRFEGQKKLRLSVANAHIMKARDDLDFKKRKWEEELEEKKGAEKFGGRGKKAVEKIRGRGVRGKKAAKKIGGNEG